MHSFLRTKSFIANKWVEGLSEDSLKVVDKYSQGLLADISLITEMQMDEAITSSEEAFEKMNKLSAGQKSAMLEKLVKLLEENKDSFAKLICAEVAKPINYAHAEVERCITTLKLSAKAALEVTGEVVPMDFGASTNRQAYTQRFGLGPIGCIAPFNFPLNLALHKIGPALAIGNSVIIKPSPYTPLSLLAFGELIKEAGYPDGAVNIVICDNYVAQSIVEDDRIKFFSFTGSPKVGWDLKQKSGQKKVTLELGGNAAVIVDKTADIEKAASEVVNGAFLFSGQICISTQRVYVDSDVYDQFIELALENADEVICGNPHDPNVSVGPIIDEQHVLRIHSWVQEAVAKGATVLTGGHILDEEHNIYAPTILTDTSPDMDVVKEEIFGPVFIVERTDSFDDAIELVNDSRFGLQAGIYTNQLDQMKYAFKELDVGGVIINGVPGFRVDNMPYGGIKDSGLGREGIKYAIEDMSEMKLLVY